MLRAFLALAALASAGCRPARHTLEDVPPEVTLFDVKVRRFQGNDLAALGHAARVTYERYSADFVAYDGWMRFPGRAPSMSRADPNGQAVDLQAPEVRGNLARKQADGLGGVRMQSSDGTVGQTQRAHFDGVGMIAAGTDPVHLSGPRYQLVADHFLFHFRDQHFEFDQATTVLGDAK